MSAEEPERPGNRVDCLLTGRSDAEARHRSRLNDGVSRIVNQSRRKLGVVRLLFQSGEVRRIIASEDDFRHPDLQPMFDGFARCVQERRDRCMRHLRCEFAAWQAECLVDDDDLLQWRGYGTG
jgi:hypothetical protein